MGAWIETNLYVKGQGLQSVAPYMGAWIETLNHSWPLFGKALLPIWEHGLKH